MTYPFQMLDDKDTAILRDRQNAWDKRPGPRVGDFVNMPDGTLRRFTHDWGDDIQTTWPKHGGLGSFYFDNGHMSYSGSLDHAILKSQLTDTGQTRMGAAWFFHHNEQKAHNGVHSDVPCRVFDYTGAP